jgi:putative transposase
MRKNRFTEVQIIGMIKEQEAGLSATELCRKDNLPILGGNPS